jgi:hypothetical protein
MGHACRILLSAPKIVPNCAWRHRHADNAISSATFFAAMGCVFPGMPCASLKKNTPIGVKGVA